MYLDWEEMSYNKFPAFSNSFNRDKYESWYIIDKVEYEYDDDEELDEDELQD